MGQFHLYIIQMHKQHNIYFLLITLFLTQKHQWHSILMSNFYTVWKKTAFDMEYIDIRIVCLLHFTLLSKCKREIILNDVMFATNTLEKYFLV